MNTLRTISLIVFTLLVSIPSQLKAELSTQHLETPPVNKTVEKPYSIVCSTAMISDVVERIAGKRAVVTGLMGSGVDPHLYKPTRSDIALLSGADLVFYNGLLLEGKMTDALIRVAVAGKKVYAISEALDPKLLLEPAEFQGHYDPHIWMDPRAWSKIVPAIRDRLSEFDKSSSDYYQHNSALYMAELEQLDKLADAALSSITKDARVLITAHDAFNYFGRRYGFEVLGIQGISTESEAGIRDIEKMVELLVARKIPAVFVESTVSERNIRALIEGARARGHHVKVGGQLFSDAMGSSGTYLGTYIGMIDHNVTTIARALNANVPETGLFGKL